MGNNNSKNIKIEKLKDLGLPVKEEAFLLFLWIGTAGAFLGLVMTLINRQFDSLPTTVVTFLACVVCCVICRKPSRVKYIVRVIVCLLSCVVFPIMYFDSGAIRSAMFLWFAMLICLSSIVLDGMSRVIICSLQLIINIAVSFIAYKNPEMVTGFMSERQRTSANITAFLVVIISLSFVSVYIIRNLERANRELEAAKKEAETAAKSKSMFLAAMSHEIRTPLNAIVNLNEGILGSNSLDEMQDNAKVVQYSASVLSGIIDDVLDFSKIEQGSFSVNESEYTTKSLFAHFNMLSTSAENKGLEFKVKESHQNPLPNGFLGDDVRIKQIGYNIISNAVKYTDSGSVNVQVSFIPDEYKDYDGWLKISVTDTGIGIKENDLSHLFEAFERVDLRHNNHIQGTGLGLAITKMLVDLMHGMIQVNSVYGKGSTFVVAIPQKMANAHDEEVEEKTYDFGGLRILACDDNMLNLKVFSKILEYANAIVVEAESGERALEILKENEFDLIYMDYRMPLMDGKECMQQIRELGIDVPVIVLTADVADNPRVRYLNMGFDDFVPKPIDRQELYRVTEKYANIQK